MDKKKLPLGIDNFRKMIDDNFYFIDKSELIKEILDNQAEVYLFTRPRRFGKTLNMSMIETFFNIEEKNKKYFENLKISNEKKYMEEQGKYPVISISFKDIKANNWEEMKMKLKYLISILFEKFDFIKQKLNEKGKKVFNEIVNEINDLKLNNSLKILTDFLYEYYGQKVIVLIDEYDAPVTEAYENEFYNEAIEFFRNLYGSLLKNNDSIKFGIMTGIVKITQQSIFSDLNNVVVNSVMSKKFSEYFGLTENEVKEILSYYNMDFAMIGVEKWYNGYIFGNSKVYNPWSIIQYLNEKELKSYWINSSRNALINDILYRSNKNVFEDLKRFLSEETVEKWIFDGISFVDLMDNRNEDNIWQLFLHSGYLTLGEIKKISPLEENTNIYKLKIPNNEVKSFFEETFISRFLGGFRKINDFMQYLKEKKVEMFEETIQNMMEKLLSFNDLKKLSFKEENKYKNMDKEEIEEEKEKQQKYEYERFYHIFMLGMMGYLTKEYDVSSNRESGYGYYDIILEPLDKTKEAYIFEFKLAKSIKELEKKAIEGYKQILEKDYEMKLRANGIKNISKYSMAFWKKKVKVCDEKMYFESIN